MSRNFRILAGKCADALTERGATWLFVQDGRITELAAADRDVELEPDDIDGRDCLLTPGFIDIHVHGGAGRAIMEANEAAQSAVAKHLARHGVTGFLATTVTGPWPLQSEAVSVAARAMRSPENGMNGAAVLGVHLEGPYINPKKKGAQPPQYILTPSIDDLVSHLGNELDVVKVVTLAPEMEGALDMIRFLSARGIVSSMGHTDATYEQMRAAIDAGARHVTHCYNAMRPLEGREPGVVGAALSSAELTAELIWDNIHVHPASCRALINAKGTSGVILISDGIPGTGMEEGYSFSLGDLPVEVRNGTARLPDGTLAGSLLTMDKAHANADGFDLCARAAMTSFNAASALGLSHRKGLLRPGYDCDVVLLDVAGEVRATLVAGNLVYSRQK